VLVETAILLPLLLLIGLGGALFGVAMVERQTLTWTAQQAAAHGASRPDPCPEAMSAADALLGRPVTPGSSCVVDASVTPTVIRVHLVGTTYAVPFFGELPVAGDGAAVVP
jgi:hypothetical protein